MTNLSYRLKYEGGCVNTSSLKTQSQWKVRSINVKVKNKLTITVFPKLQQTVQDTGANVLSNQIQRCINQEQTSK